MGHSVKNVRLKHEAKRKKKNRHQIHYPSQTLARHRDELRSFGLHQIGLFGSFVRREEQVESDIAIYVEFEPAKETINNFKGLFFVPDDLFEGREVEVVTMNASDLSTQINRISITSEINFRIFDAT